MERAADTWNVCSDIYAPPATLVSSKPTAQKPVTSWFDQQKVHLDHPAIGKVTTLQGRKLVIEIVMSCTPEPGSLSAKVLAANADKLLDLPRQTFLYTVTDSTTIAQITAQAESDNCVRGVTPEVPTELASLVLTSSDSALSFQTHLTATNYAHAYKSMVLKANSIKSKVAFIDTGVDCTHPDLAGNMVSGCGASFVSGQSLNDVDGHGTHTLGIVGAVSDNSIGVMGIAGNTATMTAIKVIHNGSGSSADAANGIEDAISRGVDVINISLQAQTRLTTVEQKIADAVNAGIVVTIAAGNYSQRISSTNITSPAMAGRDIDGAITVASFDADSHRLSSFSNFGIYAEIAAPGALSNSNNAEEAGLYSTDINGNYIRMAGTSQAAPVVAGAVALLVQFFRQRSIAFTPAQIEQIIKISTDSRSIDIDNGRVLNFSKLTRAAYQFAGVDLCSRSSPDYPNNPN